MPIDGPPKMTRSNFLSNPGTNPPFLTDLADLIADLTTQADFNHPEILSLNPMIILILTIIIVIDHSIVFIHDEGTFKIKCL